MAGFECVATGRSIERLLNASFHDTTPLSAARISGRRAPWVERDAMMPPAAVRMSTGITGSVHDG